MKKNIDYVKYNWEVFFSEKRKQLSMTREHKSKFTASIIDPSLIISQKVFEIFKIILTSGQFAIKEKVKQIFALRYLLELLENAKDWWQIKFS